MYIEYIGWIGFIFLIGGYYLNAKQNILCFISWVFGNILLLVYAVIINALPQVATALVVLVMNIYGYLQWSKDD
jgi:hypothetical protein